METTPDNDAALCQGRIGADVAGIIWDSINTGLILIDSAGKVLLWNAWVAQHSAIPARLAIGYPLEALFPDSLTMPFKSAIQRALQYRLPIILSNALHRSPLPLYLLPITQEKPERIQQSITITPVVASAGEAFCLIQIADATLHIRRERVLKSHTERLGKEAVTDALTGAKNRRFFDERFAAEFGRAQRQNTPLSLIMLDVDYFKRYNDKYGHPAGDNALISVVKALRSQLNRPTDVVARYGGEEFVVILPDANVEGSDIIAERMRRTIAGLCITHGDSDVAGYITVSIGIATYLPDTRCNTACFLEMADTALYSAKHDGRNCVRHRVTTDCPPPCTNGAAQDAP